ncbi:MAG: tyrosine recombinase XerD [Firmicutes bacterium]|jgi:integrase/recombinase XerD|nr:tyrosine recombinase XerD [Bacillota bacterium]
MATELSRDAEEFLGYLAVEKGRSKNTLASYKNSLSAYEKFLKVNLHKSYLDVTPGDVEGFSAFLVGQHYSRSSVAQMLSAVKGFYRFILEEKKMAVDPTSDVSSIRRPRLLPKPISVEEVDMLLSSVSGTDSVSLRDSAILEVMYAGGLRISEVTSLRLGDVKVTDTGLWVVSVLGKGSKERIVPIGRPAQVALSAWLGEGGRQAIINRYDTGKKIQDSLWVSSKGKPMTRQTIWRVVKERAAAVGLSEKITPHTLRHSFASHMIDNGADIRVIQELLGHASLVTTQIYTKISDKRLKEVYSKTHPRAAVRRS